MPKREYYTQRDWDRTIGWGKVPKEYQYPHLRNTEEYNDTKTVKHSKKKLDTKNKS